MADNARKHILDTLRTASRQALSSRPALPPMPELDLDKEQMIARFTAELSTQTGVVLRAADAHEVVRLLTETARTEKLSTIIAATDSTIAALDLKTWGAANGITVQTAPDFPDRETFRAAAFAADAGITGADFACAETGTLGLIFYSNQPRLISIAPPLHIAVVPVDRLVPVYERAISQVFQNRPPSQFGFITGPSASADIQAVGFKGMHGPRKLIVILVG